MNNISKHQSQMYLTTVCNIAQDVYFTSTGGGLCQIKKIALGGKRDNRISTGLSQTWNALKHKTNIPTYCLNKLKTG